jgi:hypothetical protein
MAAKAAKHRPAADWGEKYREHNYVPGPDDPFFFMGAQVGWDKGREAAPADGECPTCGSAGEWRTFWLVPTIGGSGEEVTLFYPGAIRPGDPAVCAKCMRWGRDAQLADVIDAEIAVRGTFAPDPLTADLDICSREQMPPDDPGMPFGPATRTARFRVGPDGGLVRAE